MTLFLYNLVMLAALPAIVIYHWYRSLSRGRAAAFRERFGFIDSTVLEPLQGSDVIWVHAVSVGETIAVAPLLAALKKEWPHRRIVLSNTTETGREVGRKNPHADACLHFPFDYRFSVKRLLRLVKPSLIVVMETEIWPNFLSCAHRLRIPVVLVNGRISDRSAGRYASLSWFFRPVLRNVTALCMQSREDGKRVIAAGAEEQQVHVTGNLKYDIPVGRPSVDKVRLRREQYRLPPDAVVFTAGSTHDGEDAAVLEAFASMTARWPESVLVLVPRHPERGDAVESLVRQNGLKCVRLSSLGTETIPGGGVLLVDRVGVLNDLYSVSDIAFVGGSLVPTGGHNVLEPAAFGLPVLFGPHMTNFREISAAILKAGAGLQVMDAQELTSQLVTLAGSSQLRREVGDRGLRWLEESRGAVERHMEVLRKTLPLGERR